MNLRSVSADAQDATRLAEFRCSTGAAFEDDVEQWIAHHGLAWLNDRPRAVFQRRALNLVEDDDGALVAIVAWQDIVRIDRDGIWLEVLAVATDHQHHGTGEQVLALATDHFRTIERDSDDLACLVHPDNHRSRRMLTNAGWLTLGRLDDHDLMIGRL